MASINSSMDISFDISLDSTFDSRIEITTDSANHKIQENGLIDKIMLFYLRHNLTLVCLEDHMKLQNESLDECDKLPTGKKQIIKLFQEHRDLIDIFYFVQCDKCQKKTKIDSKSLEKVTCCNITLKKAETNFFVIMPIENQIMKCIRENWCYISKFDTSINDKKTISDVHDGAILKNVESQYSSDVNVLSLCINLDGANKFDSNDLSVWPIQLIQNYLPPNIRFQPRNIIIAGLYYSDVKLNPHEYLMPLVTELNHLKENNITMHIETQNYMFEPIITHCAVDLPAKSMLQQMKQFGGYDACSYCEIPGEIVEILPKKKPRKNTSKVKKPTKESQNRKPTKCVRYVEGNQSYKMRDEVETLKTMQAVSTSNSQKPVDGIKDVSCLVGFDHFNFVWSVSIDYLHCVLLGVSKQLTNFFFDSKYNGKSFYIKPQNRKILNARILAIRPSSDIVRKPRSLTKRSNFTGSEFRSMLLYYLPVCLPGLVPNVYVQHVRLLSAAVYILLKADISSEEINDAEKMLNTFVKQHQDLFGKESMVMNVHLLKHLAECVRQLGPLWSHSTFPFERNNGCLLKLVNGTSDVLHQISTKFSLLKSITKKNENTSVDNKILLGKCVNIVETSTSVLSIDSSKILSFSDVALSVHKRINLNNTIYTSTLYTRPKRSVDYFIGLKNEVIGMAKYYFDFNGNICVVLEQFEIIDNINHILKVRTTKQNVLAPIDDIETKFVFMKVGPHQYIAPTPNSYENE